MTGNPEATRPDATGDIASMVDDGVPVPRVFNKHHGDAPPDAVYIGRGSPWGNPFRIGKMSRDEVCDRFETEILPTLDVSSLRGKNLVCFCVPLRCHGDAILKKANAPASDDGVTMKKETEMDGAATDETTAEEREELHEWAKRWSGYAPANVGALIRDFDRQAARLVAAEATVAEARKVIGPFAGAVFNDNGAVTLDTSDIHTREYLRARAWLLAHPEPTRPT